jgi:xanthine dehydrogenase accessory factor
MVCPIGLPGITGKEPAVIALAVVAQLLQSQGAADPLAATDRDCV